jgi:hypothetical protein
VTKGKLFEVPSLLEEEVVQRGWGDDNEVLNTGAEWGSGES